MKTHKKTFSFILAFIFTLSACNTKAKQEAEADIQLEEIESLIQQNKLSVAKIKIDSLHAHYKRLVNKRKIAAAWADTIARRESVSTLHFCQNTLPGKKKQLDSMLTSFKLEKDLKYQEIGTYVHKSQITENNLSRNYLKLIVDESAKLFLVNCISTGNLNQYAIRISAADQLAQTDTTNRSAGQFYRFDVDGIQAETLTFDEAQAESIATFMYTNLNSKLKITVLGKKKLDYQLSEGDKKAIASSYRLWKLKKEVTELEKKQLNATVKIQNINLRY